MLTKEARQVALLERLKNPTPGSCQVCEEPTGNLVCSKACRMIAYRARKAHGVGGQHVEGSRRREAWRHNRPPSDAEQVKRLHAEGLAYDEIAEATGLKKPTVWVIVNHGSWAQYQKNKRASA